MFVLVARVFSHSNAAKIWNCYGIA